MCCGGDRTPLLVSRQRSAQHSAESCVFIMGAGLLSTGIQSRHGAWNVLGSVKGTTLTANRSTTFRELKSWIIQWDLGFWVQCWCLTFIEPFGTSCELFLFFTIVCRRIPMRSSDHSQTCRFRTEVDGLEPGAQIIPIAETWKGTKLKAFETWVSDVSH